MKPSAKPGRSSSADARTARLPLPTLLSQTLVAFTIEFDNEFEHRMPHRTTNHGSISAHSGGLWLVSLAMWSNCMQFLVGKDLTVAALRDTARTMTNLNGMERWGYIVVQPDPNDNRPKPPRSAWLVHATPKGRLAQQVWHPLFEVIEERWHERFGRVEVMRLRELMYALIRQIDIALPDCLPILKYGLFSQLLDRRRQAAIRPAEADSRRLPLSTVLSRVLLAFAIEFEQNSELSLAICANLLRVLDEKGVAVRHLPLLTGVSKEAIHMATGILQKRRLIVVESGPPGIRGKIVCLTSKGQKAQDAYRTRLEVIEQLWQKRFGSDTIVAIQNLLERWVGKPTAQLSPLFLGLNPYPDGWRASVPKPDTLPHYPMVLHRGGFPDGS
jgi:DNA-binding MarR family transcriptional regulator